MIILIIFGIFGLSAIAVFCVFKIKSRGLIPDFRLLGYMTGDKLTEYISARAAEHTDIKDKGDGLELSAIRRTMKACNRLLINKAGSGELFGFERWLIDNFYLIENQYSLLKDQIHALRELPSLNGVPRIYLIASDIIKHSEGALNGKTLAGFINAYQKNRSLTYREIINLPVAFKYAVLEYITILMSKCVVINSKIEQSKRVTISYTDKRLTEGIKYNSFIYGVYQRQDGIKHFEEILKYNGMNLDSRLDSFYHNLAKYNTLTENAVTSLRETDRALNSSFLIDLSAVNKIFGKEAAHIYRKMTLDSRMQYLERVSVLSNRYNMYEQLLAEKAVHIANEENTHIGSVLLDRPYLITGGKNINKKAAERFYVAAALLLSAAFPVCFGLIADAPLWAKILSGILMYPLSMRAIRYIMSYVSAKTMPRIVPCIDVSDGIPDDARTMLAVSQLINSREEMSRAVDNLKMLAAANRDKNLSFALLADLPPADSEYAKNDKDITEAARDIRYEDRDIRVYIRRRVYNKETGKYSGYERKRGAILNLNEHLLSGSNYFSEITGGERAIKYIISLDADSMLNSASELVGAMLHPQNSRFGIITPSLVTNPVTTANTLFSNIYGGRRGHSSYNGYDADCNFRLFEKGNYCGKGIYCVKDFHNATAGAFQDNRILSHDYIEGAMCGAAHSCVTMYETAPVNYYQFIMRQLRWMRGDIQLLPYIFPVVRDKYGRVKNKLSALSRLNIFMNIIDTLVPAALISVIIICAFIKSCALLSVAAIALFCPLLIACAGILKGAVRGYTVNAPRQFLYSITGFLLNLATLPHRAVLFLGVHAVTLYRLIISKKNLLKWQTFSHANTQKITLKQCLLSFIINYILIILFVLAAVFAPYGAVWLTLGIGAVLLIAPFTVYAAGLTGKKRAPDTNKCRAVILDTWKYFNTQFESGFLVSDNYQEDYNKGFADRTSPTNIGFSLVCAACAFDLGLIGEDRLLQISEGVMKEINGLPKWKGHLYNWYNNVTRETLAPEYVSSVDSGNLLVSLITLKGALKSLQIADTARRDSIIKSIEEFAGGMDFSPLFDTKRGLIKIGYNRSTDKADEGCYDLLASEASLMYYALTALGKLDKSCWYNLARQQVNYGGNMLYSWSGGMFEYLMPFLFMYSYKNTLIDQSNANAVRAQVKYAARHKLPAYGISESQYNYTDTNKNYQYMGFGINNISLRPSQSFKVVSPYSTALSYMYNVRAAEKNLERLEFAKGGWGYYEAADNGKVIKTYMAHHQAMFITALFNVITDGKARGWFNYEPDIRAANILLTEEIPGLRARKKRVIKEIYLKNRKAYCETVTNRRANLLTNGKYSVVTDNEGYSYSSFDLLLTRNKGILNDNSLARINIIDKNGRRNISEKAECIFSEHRTIYKSVNGNLETEQEIFVPPNINGEIKTIRIYNNGDKTENFVIESYAEITMCGQAEDLSHPAFSGLFIESEFCEENNCLIFRRRNRENKLLLSHAAALNGKRAEVSYESNKANYYYRGGARPPSVGNILDPIASLSVAVSLKSGESTEVTFGTFAAHDYKQISRQVNNLYKNNFTENCVKAIDEYEGYKTLGITGERKLRDIATGLMYGSLSKASVNVIRSSGVLAELHKRGINTGMPFYIIDYRNGTAINDELKIIERLSRFYINFNCIILYGEETNYMSALRQNIDAAVNRMDRRSGGTAIIIINENEEKQEFIYGVRALGSYEYNTRKNIELSGELSGRAGYAPAEDAGIGLSLGIGGFTYDGGYAVDITALDTPKPWSNVIAHKDFGTLITERGGGYTFLNNSRECKLTSFSNSPSDDRLSEMIILSEGKINWTPVKVKDNGSKYLTVHSAGSTVFYNNYNGFNVSLTETIDKTGKLYIIKIKNAREHARKLRINLLLDVILGTDKNGTRRYISTELSGESLKIFNIDNGLTVFVDSNYALKPDNTGHTCIDNNVSVYGEIEVGREEREFIFRVSTVPAAVTEKYAVNKLNEARGYFGNLGNIIIKTQDESLDMLVNKWLPYQILSARFNAKCGYYQAGGAVGFRDQLQDAVNLLSVDAGILREHILLSARHQYIEGDVQHWWHFDRYGVRTRISDDLLFLPWAVCEYAEKTGDTSILAAQEPYLASPVLNTGEHARLEVPEYTEVPESIYLHCMRAILKCAVVGKHGLVLMGGGDWNDAMDKVGIMGEGESVWLSMFLYYVTKRFLPYVKREEDRAALTNIIRLMRDAVTSHGYNGEWFNRAYDDSGNVIGSPESSECKIDLLSQAWAVLSGIADGASALKALKHAVKYLVDKESGIIKLLTPPFKKMPAGYISEYPEGIRENGGQYTHAAAWFIKALLEYDADLGYELLKMINPAERASTKESAGIYKGEPYVMAADVYSHSDYKGMAGWTYYTGSAGHYYTLITETLLGIRVEGDRLYVNPRLPSAWKGYSVRLRQYDIEIEVKRTGKPAIIMDKIRYNMQYIMLTNGMRGKKITVEI